MIGENNMEEKDYQRITFRIDKNTLGTIQKEAKKQYLSVSAYIRKCIDLELNRKGE